MRNHLPSATARPAREDRPNTDETPVVIYDKVMTGVQAEVGTVAFPWPIRVKQEVIDFYRGRK